MSECALALLEAVAIPVDHDDAADQGCVLSTRAGHSAFQQIGVVLGWINCLADHVKKGLLHMTRELFADAFLESALVAGVVGLGHGAELGGAG
jgi:hypothetical protein